MVKLYGLNFFRRLTRVHGPVIGNNSPSVDVLWWCPYIP